MLAVLAPISPVVIPVLLLIGTSMVARTVHHLLFERHFKLTFVDAPVWSFFYYGAWSVFVVALFSQTVVTLFGQVSVAGYIALLFLFLVVFPAVYRGLLKHGGSPAWLVALFPDQGMLTLEERYIFAKIGDVFFQQLISGVLILTLFQAGVAYPVIVFSFVALFALAHVYLFRTAGFIWGLYYTTYAVLGGFAFPFFIIFVPAGIWYAIILHMLFYVLSAAFFAKLPRPGAAICHDVVGAAPVG